MQELNKEGSSQQAASMLFLKAGISGHRYLDRNSRSAKSGTYNFVIWDASKITMTGITPDSDELARNYYERTKKLKDSLIAVDAESYSQHRHYNNGIMSNDYFPVTLEEYSLDIPDLSEYSDRVRRLVEASVAPETRRAYTSRLRQFANWCQNKSFSPSYPIAPEIIAMYITDMAQDGLSCATIEQTMAAISTTNKAQGLPSPTETLLVKKLLKGCRREYGTSHKRPDAATVEIVRYLLNSIHEDYSPKNVRDRAIIALGFAGAFRRSELCSIDFDNLKWVFRGT